jgi:hypothetical protein
MGTVSQGVVTYNITISFDAQEDSVKPGMSVSAAIITEAKQDVIIVSSSALKSSGDIQYVEVLVDNAPQSKTVETGLSNDTMTEITSGLSEGDQVITQTVAASTASAKKTNTTQNSAGIGIPGITGGGSGEPMR